MQTRTMQPPGDTYRSEAVAWQYGIDADAVLGKFCSGSLDERYHCSLRCIIGCAAQAAICDSGAHGCYRHQATGLLVLDHLLRAGLD